MYRCPKCERNARQCAEVTVGMPGEDSMLDGNEWWDAVAIAATYPVFRCDECIAVGEDGVEEALSFGVNCDWVAFDPAKPEVELRFDERG